MIESNNEPKPKYSLRFRILKLIYSYLGWRFKKRHYNQLIRSSYYPHYYFQCLKGRKFIRRGYASINGFCYNDAQEVEIPYWKLIALNFK